MIDVVTGTWTMLVWVTTLAQSSAPSGGGWQWGEYGLVGVCLAAVAAFAKQSVDRERARADATEGLLKEELRIERERNQAETARIIAQRDGLIQEIFREALPVLQRTSDVLGKRQVIDEQQVEILRQTTDVLSDVRRLLEARQA